MAKIKPNVPCPCGSGLKYKKCHSGKELPRPHVVSIPEGFDMKTLQAVHVDHDNKLNIVFTNDMLVNQLTRDTAPIEASFDAIAEEDLKAASALFGEACSIFFPQLIKKRNGTKGPQSTCARLLSYAAESYTASLHLARGGYRRQYGAMTRNIVETLAVVLTIYFKPEALEEFNRDELSSTKAITFAKKILPPFGTLYGHLSNTFVHVGDLQNQPSRLNKYDKEEDALKYILSTMRVHAWLIYVVTEFVFYFSVARPKYWRKLADLPEGTQFVYDPSEEGLLWIKEHFDAALDTVASTKSKKDR